MRESKHAALLFAMNPHARIFPFNALSMVPIGWCSQVHRTSSSCFGRVGAAPWPLGSLSSTAARTTLTDLEFIVPLTYTFDPYHGNASVSRIEIMYLSAGCLDVKIMGR